MSSIPSLGATLRGVADARVLRAAVERDEESSFWELTPESGEAVVVEGDGSLKAARVPCGILSEFEQFLDGAQTSRAAVCCGLQVGVLGFVNAAVLRRVNRDMLSSDGLYRESLALYLGRCSDELENRLVDWPIPRLMPGTGQTAGLSPCYAAIRNRVSEERNRLEQEVADAWARSGENGWLLVDGGLSDSICTAPEFVRAVGIVKSHATAYFSSAEDAQTILSLVPGERTSVFELKGSWRNAYSWYLRLREDAHAPPPYGLIRVEMQPLAESLLWTDRVSAWIMDERNPLSLPDVRYDRLLYPIRRVEQFLKSRQPSGAQFSGWIGA